MIDHGMVRVLYIVTVNIVDVSFSHIAVFIAVLAFLMFGTFYITHMCICLEVILLNIVL